jgi:GTP:adenosylcobinamide-phosphate guanylyltransferase
MEQKKDFSNLLVRKKSDLIDEVIKGVEQTTKTKVVQKTQVQKQGRKTETPPWQKRTYAVGTDFIETLEQFIISRKRTGEFEYNQRSAIEEALDLLFAKYGFEKIKM